MPEKFIPYNKWVNKKTQDNFANFLSDNMGKDCAVYYLFECINTGNTTKYPNGIAFSRNNGDYCTVKYKKTKQDGIDGLLFTYEFMD